MDVQSVVMDSKDLYFLAWSLEPSINWNQAASLGAYTLIAFYVASWPARKVYEWITAGLHLLEPTWKQLGVSFLVGIVSLLGASIAMIMVGVITAYGLRSLGLQQQVILDGTQIGYAQSRNTSEPRKVYLPTNK